MVRIREVDLVLKIETLENSQCVLKQTFCNLNYRRRLISKVLDIELQ